MRSENGSLFRQHIAWKMNSHTPLFSRDPYSDRVTNEEKKVIMDAVAGSLRNPGSAKYHWAKFPAVVT